MGKRLTTYEFIEKAKKVHGSTYDYSLTDYKHSLKKVIIICKIHGEFQQIPKIHITGSNCPECAELSRQKEKTLDLKRFIEKARKIHGDKYRYSKYLNTETKISISCDIHGDFKQTPHSHLNGRGCPKCAIKNRALKNTKNEECFLEEANETHSNYYKYYNNSYINGYTKIKICCKIHGDFKQKPDAHIQGQGCPKCSIYKEGWNYTTWKFAGDKSIYFDSFKIYIIRCWDDEEEFYKIGKTFWTIYKRFNSKKKMPYNYEIIKVFKGGAREISELEQKLQNINKNFKYIPKIKFGGMYECFSKLTKY